MDLLRLAHPWVVAVILPVWAILAWPALRSSPRRPGALGRAVLACLSAGLLLAALAGPSLRVSSAGASAVCIVQDVSPSMALAGGDAAARAALPDCAAALADVPIGLVQFDATVFFHSAPARREAVAVRAEMLRLTVNGRAAATDVAAGLQAASLALPEAGGIVVLYTDARETRGDAVRAATRLAARGIQVHAVLPTLAAVSDVRLAGLDAPPRADLGAAVAIRLRLISTRPADVTVRLERPSLGDEEAVDRQRRVRVEPGVGAELLFEDTPPAEGDWTYTAEITADSDAVPENNRASCVVRVGEPRTVLYVYAGAAPGPILDLLRKHGLRVAAVRAEEGLALPGAGASAVILDNVSAWALGPGAPGLADLVARGGLGLLAIGGDAAFAAGGYGDSFLEDILPVSSRTGRRPPLEMVLVIDSSGSMNETVGSGPGAPRKITLAKQAVLALHAALAPADRIGIVAFAGEPRTVSTLVPASEWETLRSRLVSLEASGGTRITPALAGALDLLPPAAAGENQPVRHLLLLSDGRSQDFDLPLLIARCRERGVSVSAVATGADARLARDARSRPGRTAEADADLESLGRLARETGGRLYRSTDLARLAETFLKDLTWARGEGLTEGVFPAAWRDPQPVWRQPGPTLPAVAACNVTRPKEGASILWETAGTELGTLPLLAVWRRGLGKAAAMPWPAGRAGGAWLADDGLGRYLRDILAWLEGPASPAAWSARVFDRDGRWRVRVEQASSAVAATPVRFSAAVFEAGAPGARQIALEAVEPGAAEADLGPRTARGATLIVRSSDEGSERMTLALPGLPPREYERFGVDRPLLERIVTAGGGKIHENPESLAEAVRQAETRRYRPVGIHLVWAAAAVVVGLVLGRLLGRL